MWSLLSNRRVTRRRIRMHQPIPYNQLRARQFPHRECYRLVAGFCVGDSQPEYGCGVGELRGRSEKRSGRIKQRLFLTCGKQCRCHKQYCDDFLHVFSVYNLQIYEFNPVRRLKYCRKTIYLRIVQIMRHETVGIEDGGTCRDRQGQRPRKLS